MNCKQCLYCNSDLISLFHSFSTSDFNNLQISKCNKCNTTFRFTRHLNDNDKPDGWTLKTTEILFHKKLTSVSITLTDTTTAITILDASNKTILLNKRLPVTPTNFDPIKIYLLFS